MEKSQEILQQLSEPFTMIGTDGKEYPAHKWFPKVMKGEFAQCVPYIEAGQVIARLNNVLGVDGWSNTLIETVRHENKKIDLICEITIIVDGKAITRSNIGTEGNIGGTKSTASDALKRTARMFGVGEYLYSMQSVKLPKVKSSKDGKTYAATDDGKALMTGDDLTSYINLKHPLRAKLTEIYHSLTKKQQESLSDKFVEIWNNINV